MHYWSTIKNIKFQILIKNVKKKYGNFIIKYRRISNRNRPIVTKYRRFCLTYLSIIIGYRTNFYRYYRTIDNEPIIDIYHHRSTTLFKAIIIIYFNNNSLIFLYFLRAKTRKDAECHFSARANEMWLKKKKRKFRQTFCP